MGGIYLQYSENLKDREYNHLKNMLKYATRTSNDKLESFGGAYFSGKLIHYGRFKSCGLNTARDGNYTISIYGGCWLDDNDADLASPDEILSYILKSGLSDSCVLKGNYVYALLNHLTKELIVENDLFGVYPLYYLCTQDGSIYISSEIKSLIPVSKTKICIAAVAEMLKYGYIVSDLTLVEGIHRLMPNSRLKFLSGKLEVDHLKFSQFDRNIPFTDEISDALNEAFVRNILRYGKNNQSFSVSLSGGLDSRIAAFATKKLGLNLKSWSSGEKHSLECQMAKKISAQLDIEHMSYEYDGQRFPDWIERAVWITEGRCPPGHMHFLEACINSHYSKEIQIHGLIGDAVIGGDFDNHNIIADYSSISKACVNSIKGLIYWPNAYLNKIVSKDIDSHLSTSGDRVSELIFNRIRFNDEYSDYLWFRYYFRVFGFTIPCLASQIIPWTDPIFPYLDNKFFEISSKIKLDDIADRTAQIEWANRHYPGISSFPRIKDGVSIDFKNQVHNEYDRKIKRLILINNSKYGICRISRGLINLPSKETYPYYDQWYRKWPAIRNLFKEILLSDRVQDRGLFDAMTIRHILKDLRIGKNLWNAAATLLLLELFFRQFIDQDNFRSPNQNTFHDI